MEMFGGSTMSYLARTPRIPLFVLIFIRLETKNVLDYQGRAGSTSLYSGLFARSYSVSNVAEGIVRTLTTYLGSTKCLRMRGVVCY